MLRGQAGTPTTERKSMQALTQSDTLLHSKPKGRRIKAVKIEETSNTTVP